MDNNLKKMSIVKMLLNKDTENDDINDYKIDLKSELILEELHDKMDKIIKNQQKIIKNIKD